MPIRHSPEDPQFVKSLRESLAAKKTALDFAISEYCELKAQIMAQELVTNGQPLPQERFSRLTIRSIIIQHLKQNPSGSNIFSIKKYLRQFGKEPATETISSTLNRLKRDGIVEKSRFVGKNWVISEFGNGAIK